MIGNNNINIDKRSLLKSPEYDANKYNKLASNLTSTENKAN